MAQPPAIIRNGRPLRILHCPWNVAGQSAQLAAAERALGADSRCIVIEETAQGFPADQALAPPNARILVREAARWRLLWRAIAWADVVHFSFGQSCLVPHAYPALDRLEWRNPLSVAWRLYCRAIWLKDLPLLSAMGKKLAVTWQGDDARQHDRSLALFEASIAHELGDRYYVPGSDAWKRRTIAAFARHVPIHYALNPDLLQVLPERTRFLPYASFDPASVSPAPPTADASRPLIFAHAPSHRGAKGTEYVLAAASRLKSEGAVFELDLVEGLPRAEALARYRQSDVVIDQLLAGWYGGLGVEAMSLGKPVVAYLRRNDLEAVDHSFVSDLPIIEANPDSLYDVMRGLIAAPRANLHAMGQHSRHFVETWHDPLALAKQTLADYTKTGAESSI
ncbi:hypothetical protein ASG72_03980 [Bosea sp. Leaf344]|uniref:glycosyltransferase family 1 protein n=1 Tax=Bosea sp. Leaf344 TaxID=1736346 RepID=UPI0007153573|nr:glycosyltransferase family 1 protein [Bosea sp. Leaf344]KQU54782.1 hypothetical protein ASG72_03980 [Bosea sp. Leaf344]